MANTGSTSSSMTSTSHTMTAEPRPRGHLATAKSENAAIDSSALLKALQPENRHNFIQPSKALFDASIQFTKAALDEYAPKICDQQAARVEEARKNKKRKRDPGQPEPEILRIRKVHVDGFSVDQVWAQAKRVLDALKGEVERGIEDLGELEPNGTAVTEAISDSSSLASDDEGLQEEGEEDEASDVENLQSLGEEEEDDMELEGEERGEELTGEGIGEDYDGSVDVDGLLDKDDDYDAEDGPADEYVEDPNGLNDGFFSIDDFNKQTEFLERQDATADPYTGEASDEEDIDWDADPMAVPLTSTAGSRRGDIENEVEEDDVDDEENEEGPTFGNMDLDAPEGESDLDEDDEEDADIEVNGAGENTNDIMYGDFFEAPPRKVSKGERQTKYLARQEKKMQSGDMEEETERAMADVRRDLFEDFSDNEDSENSLSDVDPSDPKSRKSAHERRQAKLTEQIRRLETEAVAKREWMLTGEARAVDRPLNSLLEEDLDFERTGKPIPVITAEISESIEELIRSRILAQQFDEVIRRRPNSESMPVNSRRGLVELDDNRAQQSLAEIYEEEHVKTTNSDTYMSKADEKLKKQHQEVETMWKEISAKLDALSSWHYTPKPPAPSLTIVADVATVSMEDAQPSTASAIGTSGSMLAPQEIYTAGKSKSSIEQGEVVPKSGLPAARQEMTREEKLRRRRREKERIKKRGGLANQRPESNKVKAQKDTLGELKKGGVKVITRKGEIKDIDGNNVKANSVTKGAGGFKL